MAKTRSAPAAGTTSRRILRHEALDIKVVHLCAPRALKPLKQLIVVTSRKIGNAPQRNKIRRQVKAIFYEQKLISTQNKGEQWVVITKPPVTSLPFAQIAWLISSTIQQYQTKRGSPPLPSGLSTFIAPSDPS